MSRKYSISFLFLILWNIIYAQAPDVIPYSETEPVKFTPINIIIYIVIPAIIVIGFLFYRRKKRDKEKEQRNQ